MNEDQERQNYLKRVLEAGRPLQPQQPGPHLSEEEIFAFYQGQLSPAAAASQQNHLLDCRQCQQLLQEVRAFCAPPEANEAEIAPAQIQASWENLKTKLPVASGVGMPAPPGTMALGAAAGGWRWGVALAAIAVLIAGGIWRWGVLFPRTQAPQSAVVLSPTPTSTVPAATPLAESPAPPALTEAQVRQSPTATPSTVHRAGLPANRQPYPAGELLLLSGDRAVESAAPLPPRRIPGEAQSFSLKLKKYAPREFSKYRVELLDAQGAVRQTVTGQPGGDNQIEVAFACAGLAEGEYLVRLTGVPEADEATPAQVDRAAYEGKLRLSFAKP